jgi:hypothetical protein
MTKKFEIFAEFVMILQQLHVLYLIRREAIEAAREELDAAKECVCNSYPLRKI